MTSNITAKRRCANDTQCIQFALIGKPTRLSVHNKNDICFACEEHDVRVTPDRNRRSVWSAQKER